MSGVKLTRRGFLKATGLAGGGLIIAYVALRDNTPARLKQIDGALSANAFIQVTPDNTIVFYTPRDEMGQGSNMGLSTLIAEDLDVNVNDIQIEFAAAHSDYNNPEMGVQVTGGSTSIKGHYQPLRQVAADTRALLLNAAALDLEVTPGSLTTNNAHIVSNGTRYPYSDFITMALTLDMPEGTALKDKADFNYIGKEIPRTDALAKSTGIAEYGVDVDLPDMHYALVKRCPVAGGQVSSFDASLVQVMDGVVGAYQIGSGVAVVAQSFWQAKKAVQALAVEWDMPTLAQVSNPQIRADYQAALDSDEGDTTGEGDVIAGLKVVESSIESEFWTPYLAHATMEPMNAVVRIQNGEADVWSGTQGPGIAQGLVARHADLPTEKVRVHSMFLGGGFGRRAVLSHITEATQAAVASGKTVKLIWTREDDIQNGWYRPASLMKISAGIDDTGKVTVWDAVRVGGNIMPDTLHSLLPGALPNIPKGIANWAANTSENVFDGWLTDPSSVEGLIEDYDFPNKQVRHATVNHGLPLAFWRSVGHSFTAFAKESAMDELAEQAGIESIEFRLHNLQGNPRLRGVLESIKSSLKSWSLSEGKQIGIASHGSFNSYVAQAAEVSVENGAIKVHRVLCAVDCGQVINPDIVRAQMEGAIMYGLTAALYGDIEIENGRVKESNFHNYKILRMNEAPAVEVIIVDSDEAPTGVGEPGLPPIAPAVANAVYKINGQRLRSLPLTLA